MALYLRHIPPSPEQMTFYNQCQAQNIAEALESPPTQALIGVLGGIGIEYDLERKVIYDGSLCVFVDVWLPFMRYGVELDGGQHKETKRYDREKDRMVFQQTGFTVLRQWNSFFEAPDLKHRFTDLLIEADNARRLL